MKKKLVFAALATLVLAGGAALAGDGIDTIDAISYSSINASTASQSTFGLTRYGYDGLMHPWQYPSIDPGRSRHLGFRQESDGIQKELVWVQLGNTSSADTFGGAYIGKLGNGYLGAQLTYDTDVHESSSVDSVPGFDDVDNTKDTLDHLEGYVGYGWSAGDKLAHGVGLSFRDGTDEFKSYGQDTISGFRTVNSYERTDWNVRYGVKFTPSDEFSWVVSAHVGNSDADNEWRSDTLDAAGVQTSSFTMRLIELGGTSYGVGGQFNWYKGSMDYQIDAGYKWTDWEFDNTAIQFQDVGGTYTAFQNVTDDSIDDRAFRVGGTVGYHDGPLHIYGGLKVKCAQLRVDVLGDFDDPAAQQFRDDEKAQFTRFTPRIGVVYELTDHVALSAGARYVWDDGYERVHTTDIDVVTPANNEFHSTRDDWTANDSAIRAGVELRYSKLILDIGVGSGESNDQETLDTQNYYVQARFGF